MISKMFSFLILLSVASTVFAVDALTGKNITTCFATLDSAYSQIKENVEIENMPRIRDMGKFPFCAGFSAATLAQHYYCKTKKLDCTDIPLDKEFSPVAFMGLLNLTKLATGNAEYRIKIDRKQTSSLRSAPIGFSGGTGYIALRNLSSYPHTDAESCYPFDRVVKLYQEKYPDEREQERAIANVLAELEDQFSRSKRGEKICKTCLQKTIQEKLLASITPENLTAYLNDEDFDRFLYDALIYADDCKKSVRLRPAPNMDYFPKEGLSATPAEVVTKIKEVLKNGHPIDTGVCPYRENGKCLGRHSVVISGYRKMCSPTSGACRDVFKVHNSWGIDWQQRHNDGWVDAITLFGDEMQGTAALSWLE